METATKQLAARNLHRKCAKALGIRQAEAEALTWHSLAACLSAAGYDVLATEIEDAGFGQVAQ